MYIYIQIPFYLRFQNEKIAQQQHWFKLQTSSYSSWEEEEESGMRTGMVGFCTHLLCSLSVFILFVLYYSPFCCFATTTTASMHLSPAGPPPGGPNTAHNICSLLQQGKNDRIWQDKIHTYSKPGHMIQSLLLPSRWRWLSPCQMWNSISLFNFCFCTTPTLYNFFLHMARSLLETQALILIEVRD